MFWVSVSALTLLVGQQDEGHSVCKNLPRILPTDCLPSVLVSANLHWLHGQLSVWATECMLWFSVGYTMDVMYFSWLPNPIDLDKAIQLPQFRLRDSVLYDCSQNYTGGKSHYIRNDEMHTDEFKNHRISRYLSAYKQCRLIFQQSFS